MHHHNSTFFLQTVNVIEMLLAAVNMQLKNGMNQVIYLTDHNARLLVTSHGSIQHPALSCKVS